MPRYKVKIAAHNDQMEVSETFERNSFDLALQDAESILKQFQPDAGARIVSVVALDYREHEDEDEEEKGFEDLHTYIY